MKQTRTLFSPKLRGWACQWLKISRKRKSKTINQCQQYIDNQIIDHDHASSSICWCFATALNFSWVYLIDLSPWGSPIIHQTSVWKSHFHLQDFFQMLCKYCLLPEICSPVFFSATISCLLSFSKTTAPGLILGCIFVF